MKILHIIYTLGISGAEKYLRHLLPGLKNYGIETHLIIICTKETHHLLTQFTAELNNDGVQTSLIDSSKIKFIFAAKEINRYCLKNNIKIIHSHLSNSDLIAVMVKKFYNPKIIIISTKHGYDENVLQVYEPGKTIAPKNFYYLVTKYLQNNIDKNIAVSKGISDLYFDFGLSSYRFPVIHHGIHIPHFDKLDYEATCRRSKVQLIIVGRIEQFKGHHFLMTAMVEIVRMFPECKLLVLGQGSAKKKLQDQIVSLGITNNVEFLGFQPHPYSFISNSDVIILPSLFEPFGLVYIEAFALKVPVVAFDTAAGNEIMQNNVTGVMVPKGDSAMLAQKIIYLLQNIGERNRIAETAYEAYEERFTTQTMIRNTAEWYKNNFDLK